MCIRDRPTCITLHVNVNMKSSALSDGVLNGVDDLRNTDDHWRAGRPLWSRHACLAILGIGGVGAAGHASQRATQVHRSAGRPRDHDPVSYTHLRAHETVLDLVCRL